MGKDRLARDVLTLELFTNVRGRYRNTPRRCFIGVSQFLNENEDPDQPMTLEVFEQRINRKEFLQLEHFGDNELELLRISMLILLAEDTMC